jgi:hypothetical protein
MNDQVWTSFCSMSGYLLIGPVLVAVLHFLLFLVDAAPGVAEYNDAPDVGRRERKSLTIENNA